MKIFITIFLLLLAGCTQPVVKNNSILGAKETVYNVGDFKKVVKANPKDKIEVELKNKKLKISRWDDEVNLELELIDDKKKAKEVKIYDITEGEGGIEFEVDLLEKPDTNVVQFNLNKKGLDFFYQPALTQQEIDEGASRPENVVGSYAVYASEQKTNWTGGKEYKTGKVGHIFRPKIIDSAGTEVWGTLHIENGILSVTIPQDFLDKAVYPVRHAAGLTFGYTTEGGSSTSSYIGYYRASTRKYYSMASLFTAADAFVISSITFSIVNANNYTANAKAAILSADLETKYYDSADSALSGSSWQTRNIASASSLPAANYYLACAADSAGMTSNYTGILLKFDTGGTGRVQSVANYASEIAAGSANWYTSMADTGDVSGHKNSIYATYTASGGGTTPAPDDGFISFE